MHTTSLCPPVKCTKVYPIKGWYVPVSLKWDLWDLHTY